MKSLFEKMICTYKMPEDVIGDNTDIKQELINQYKKSLLCNNTQNNITRSLIKKVIQVRFGLPLKFNIEVISTCILNCEFCVLKDLKHYRRKVRMTIEDFKKIWSNIEFFTTEVEFTGGEPILNSDVFDMINETNKTGVYSTFTTNAQLLNKENCERILDVKPSRILIAYDSVDKDDYEHMRINGKFDVLKENILYLVKRKRELRLTTPEISLQMIISKRNVDKIEEFWEDTFNMGVDSAYIKPILLWPESSEEYKKRMIEKYILKDSSLSYHKLDDNNQLIESRQKGVCPNQQQVHIGSGSEVIPCWYILKNSYIAGYATDKPFLDIWFNNEYIEFRRKMKAENVYEGCKNCIGVYDPKLFLSRIYNIEMIKNNSLIFEPQYLQKLAKVKMCSIVIFGAGEAGKLIYKKIKEFSNKYGTDINIKGFFDNDINKQEKELFGQKIMQPKLSIINKIDFIIICSDWSKEIKEQLLDMGIDKNKILIS